MPSSRLRSLNDAPVRPDGEYVLYWMVAHRRARWNFALERAVEWCAKVRRPLLVFEALRVAYPWASDRLHQFVIDGMRDNQAAFQGRRGVTYFPWLEPQPDAGKGLLATLAARAAVVVTDDYPAFLVPRMTTAAARQLTVRFEAVDANGLMPIRATDRAFPTAYSFRREVQRQARANLAHAPRPDALEELPDLTAPPIPDDVGLRWPSDTAALLDGTLPISSLPIDHAVPPTALRGGAREARRVLDVFLHVRLPDYGQTRNRARGDAASGLSPYLHFGHISSWEVFSALMTQEGWVGAVPAKSTGARQGWWGVSPPAEAFLDQLAVWRELGFNTCVHRPDDYDRFESLPYWAAGTLMRHAGDEREHVYGLDAFAAGRTHDSLWNAAQGQLLVEGRINNYLRMLWGKKILEWTASPQEALEVTIELNNRFALDGRDPNSYSGIFWTLGRYDRPWAPERPVFGKVRYMSSENTGRKMPVRDYIRRYAPEGSAVTQPALWTD